MIDQDPFTEPASSVATTLNAPDIGATTQYSVATSSPSTRMRGDTSCASAPSAPLDLIRIAVERGAPIEYLERLIALKERVEASEAERAFNVAVANLRGEVIKIEKNQVVLDGPLRGRRYANLSDWVHGVSDALSKHGLSVRWSCHDESKDWIRIDCHLRHSIGHSESASMSGPVDPIKSQSWLQAKATTVNYLERYTIKMVLGLAEVDADTDGAGPPAVAQASDVALKPADRDALQAGEDAATKGMSALTKWWSDLSPHQRGELTSHFGALRAAARKFDGDR